MATLFEVKSDEVIDGLRELRVDRVACASCGDTRMLAVKTERSRARHRYRCMVCGTPIAVYDASFWRDDERKAEAVRIKVRSARKRWRKARSARPRRG